MIRLEYYRKANLYSLNQLSKTTGISRQHLKQIELGEKIPSVKIVCVLCKVFMITPNEIIEEKYYK